MVVIADASKKPLLNPTEQARNTKFLDRVRRDKSFDPHSDKFHCVDVSSYEDVNWKEKTCELCTATFPKFFEVKKQEVCIFLYYNNLSTYVHGAEYNVKWGEFCSYLSQY